MSVTINVNNLSLVHKGSGGVSVATLPDVCKTPPNSIPVPYPNVALSSNLAKGTTTVKADGGNMCANSGSQFSRSTGDEPGALGGVKSGTFAREATWITYSFDVKLEGKGACRLTDKMFQNHQNTVNMAGVLQKPLLAKHRGLLKADPGLKVYLEALCNMMCLVHNRRGDKQRFIAKGLKEIEAETRGACPLRQEVPFNPTTVMPYMSRTRGQEWRATTNWFIRGHLRPDVLITLGGRPGRDNITNNIRAVVEMKFNDADTPHSKRQRRDFRRMFRQKFIEMEAGKQCKCGPGPKKQLSEKAIVKKVKELAYGAAKAAAALAKA